MASKIVSCNKNRLNRIIITLLPPTDSILTQNTNSKCNTLTQSQQTYITPYWTIPIAKWGTHRHYLGTCQQMTTKGFQFLSLKTHHWSIANKPQINNSLNTLHNYQYQKHTHVFNLGYIPMYNRTYLMNKGETMNIHDFY